MNCPKCGEEVSPEMKFCPKCGTSLSIQAQPSAPKTSEKVSKGPDVLGFISAGVILIILALTYIRNPIDPSEVANYFETMANQGIFIKPPPIFFDAAIFFLYAAGIWGIVLSGLRIIFQRNARKALEDLVGAFFPFFFAYLLTNYAADVYTGRTTLAYFVVGIGLLVIANAIIHFALPEKR